MNNISFLLFCVPVANLTLCLISSLISISDCNIFAAIGSLQSSIFFGLTVWSLEEMQTLHKNYHRVSIFSQFFFFLSFVLNHYSMRIANVSLYSFLFVVVHSLVFISKSSNSYCPRRLSKIYWNICHGKACFYCPSFFNGIK